ncbi:MAG: tetratricopeptide repeat protein [Spirochaetaceae bacterium]
MKETTKKTTNQIISEFLTSKKKVLFIILAVIAVTVLLFGLFSNLQLKKMSKMINSTTKLDMLYNEVLSSENDGQEFLDYATDLINNQSSTKAELIAYSRLASYYFDKEDFQKSADNYTLAFTNFPNDIAASVYMFNAAMALEELGQVKETISILESIVTKYKSSELDKEDTSADVPEAIFNLGRLYESEGDISKAIEQYELLVAEYQSYNLSSLAKTRLLSIK